MVDPSLVFSENGPEWVGLNREAGVEVVVPRIVTEWLAGEVDVDPSLLLAAEDVEMLDLRLAAIRELGPETLSSFDHYQVDLDPDAREVLEGLLSSGDPAAAVWADEWAYLQSNSWLAARLRRCLDAFETAGAAVIEFGQDVGIDLIEQVIPAEHLPRSINREVILRATAKWIVVGGAHALGGTLGTVAGAGVAGPVGAAIGEKLASYAARTATTKVLLAVDP